MIVHVDTSALVDALCGPRRSLDALIALVDEGHRLRLSALVLYEWARGPRTSHELALQQELFPAEQSVTFGPEQAAVAVRLYQSVRKPRGREVDLAIAACAVVDAAALWTLNRADFGDVPGLRLVG